MAKKRPTSDNFDALGSVFDFIFTEAEKKPDKRRPIKPTGVAGDSKLTDAMFAALEMPGTFVSDSVIREFNGAINVEMGKISYSTLDQKVKLTSTGLIDLLRDPEKAFNRMAEGAKAERAAGRAVFLRNSMEDLLANAWAHKYGDIEARKAIYGTTLSKEKLEKRRQQKGMEAQEKLKSAQLSKAVAEFGHANPDSVHDLDFVSNRSFEIIKNSTFKKGQWEKLSDNDKSLFTQMVSGTLKKEIYYDKGVRKERLVPVKVEDVKKFLMNRSGVLGAKEAYETSDRYGRFVDSVLEGKNADLYDIDQYQSLERWNLKKRIDDPKTTDEEKKIYEKTQYLLQRDIKNLQDSINDIKLQLRSATTDDEKKLLKGQLKDAQGALRIIGSHNIFGRIGQVEGYLGSLREIYGGISGANLTASILGGQFFNNDENRIFNPVAKDPKAIGGIRMYVAKHSTYGNGKPKALINAYNELGTRMYYLTPRSIFRTFFYNGEGFAFLFHERLKQVNSIEGFGALGINTFKMFEKDGDYDATVSKLLASATGKLKPEDYAKLEKMLKSNKGMFKAIKAFSLPFRIQDSVQTYFKKRYAERFRHWLRNRILKSPRLLQMFTNAGADKLLARWVAKGGIDVLVRSVITAIAGTLGIALGPIGSVLVTAVTWVATDFVVKTIGVALNIFKWVVIGIVGLIVFVIGVGSNNIAKFNKETLSYRSEVPGDVVMCPLYEEVELEEGEDPWGDTIVPPPSGESCVIGAGSFSCSQGFVDVNGWTHQNMKANMPVDLTGISYIYAPQFCDTGNCSITRIAKINCSDQSKAGGVVELTASTGSTTYVFKLLHVKPLAGLGEKLSGGQPVAVVQDRPEVEKGNCWTGKHLHLETKQNGSAVDPLKLLQGFSCGVPNETGCANSGS